MAERFDRIWYNARLATMRGDRADLGEIERGLIAARDGRIVYADAQSNFPVDADAVERIDCGGRWITPGLVDCHTHLVFGGNRAHEFELRLKGASYEEIARAGGGIVSTVAATRKATEAELVAGALPRLDALIGEGATTVEIKSGYGLDAETEMHQLAAARKLGQLRKVAIRTSFLGAHALPPEADGDKDRYIDLVCNAMLPAVAKAGLADAVDAFMEGIAFSGEQTARVFAAARTLGLPVKLHADQLSNLGGAALAAKFSALSADHLEHTDEAGAAAMAKAGTVAVLLPGAFYFIRETQKPPVELFRKHGVPMALATDCNPGSSPLTSLLLAMNMGATLFRMTVVECLAAVTREGARALGMLSETGTLEAGKWCDLAIWDIERPAELVYRIGFNPLHRRVWRGQ
ncbi:imidazolonepropionase [Bradyrhizobium viridifuturi]|jgi:imidazolonepropionase|uniref:imidazolonepropionase n=1 Tax=Bradyrhizobium TaxID=374 RepID=UPI000396B266|nr:MULTISPECIES: imidazolonepropionase [Bradyrhizobium]ERF84925.1 MAG: imidazolonepropionase [Bradyrhizobium sp. DFCI-1]OYU58811.1 MAG: imidazolonepropionase [Bradyrhizobium sp. PARBB1]PSO26320.1 imidazolonepropionase [Bradyrhizobium sp. MOS004]QRI71981.1 imidazolonepropionase [Bradyrhizobium sp. PSBB068]MBR1023124.1 imidazolonepropionase [Bradyrhizobium viridifuturi]